MFCTDQSGPHFPTSHKEKSSYLEIDNGSRGLIKKFIISVGDFRFMGISKFKMNAT